MATDVSAGKIHELLPRIRERRAEIEEARRLPKDLVDELVATGIFRLGVPAVYGGEEAAPADIMRVVETIASADGSTGWCAMIGIDAAIQAGMTSEAGVAEVFADISAPRATIPPPSGTAVPVGGGVVVSGHWRFASGITHVDWVMAGCVMLDDGQPRMLPNGMPEIVHVWLPTREIEILDTWHVNGMRGTGSNDFTATEVFVPQHRVFAFFDPSDHLPQPLVRMPLAAAFAARVAAVAVGVGRAALDELVELAASKVPMMTQSPLAQQPVFQIELARAEAALAAARSLLYDAVDDVWQTLLAGRPPALQQVARARIAALHAVETAAATAERASILAGGPTVYASSSLLRHARDAGTIAHHFIVAPSVWQDAGRVFVGLEPTAPAF